MPDYLMNDITDNWPAPKAIVPGTIVAPWSPSDDPFTRDQALAVLMHAAKTRFHIDARKALLIHTCITQPVPSLPSPQVVMGNRFGDWGWLHLDGWRGGYATHSDALRACVEFRNPEGA